MALPALVDAQKFGEYWMPAFAGMTVEAWARSRGNGMSNKELAGRVAVITGAGRSIGRAMALELAEGGCAVVVNVRSNRAEAEAVVKDIESRGGRGMVGVADVVDAKAVHAMADAALKKFGRIDYLINNAALRGEKTIEHMTFEEWRHITGVVLDGAFHCVKACIEAIKKSDAGSIINVGGLTGAMGAPDRVHVVTAKAGVAGFTRGLARELAEYKITVNTLVPAMLAKPDTPNEIPAHPIYRPILGRAAWPTDFAPLARFLVGPGARYITGQTINVNGGTYFGV
jgi:NAD(P)-dependent dehydrogenase (short-subunit alcohol dehydrogenase family)